MTTDTPSSRDEEIPTPRHDDVDSLPSGQWPHVAMREAKKLFADTPRTAAIIPVLRYHPGNSAWNQALLLARQLERELIRLSAEREKEREELQASDEHQTRLAATLAERDKELAGLKFSLSEQGITDLEQSRDNLVQEIRRKDAQLLAAQTVIIRLEGALGAIERSHHCDGDGCEVCNFLMDAPSSPDPTLLDEVVKVLEMAYNRALDWDMLGRAHGNSAVQMWRENAIRLLSRLRQSTRETEREGL